MTTIETHLDGSPSQIYAAADWLRTGVATAATTYASTVTAQRTTVGSDWAGDAAEQFLGAAATLTTGGDTVSSTATTLASALGVLGDELTGTLDDLAAARTHASSGGLTVAGTLVHHPGAAPTRVTDHGQDATPAQANAYDHYLTASATHAAAIITWDEVVELVNGAIERWDRALTSIESTWSANSGNLVGVSTDVFTTFGTVLAVSTVAFNASAVRNTHLAHAATIANHLDAFVDSNGRVLTQSSHFYDLMDARATHLAAAADIDRVPARTPTALGRAFGALGVIATGYSIYDDINNGESVEQAVVSNGVGFAASLAAGAGTGAIIGSFIPVPVVGTIVGAVAGTIVGGVVGIVTSGMIDSMWENGVDGIEDVGQAIADGWGEVVATGEAIGDMASDVGGAIADGAKDVWDAIF